jgi:hypothetical protein
MNRYARVLAVTSAVGMQIVPPNVPSVLAQSQTIEITGSKLACGPSQILVNGFCQYGSISDYSAGGGSGYGGSGSYIPENEAQQIAMAVGVMTDVCKNPLATQATKNTSSQSDTTERWLAAMQLFSVNKASSFRNITHPIQAIVVNGRTSSVGFTITYSDGAKETWVVNPFLSSALLLDQPLPGMSAPTKPAGSSCNAG